MERPSSLAPFYPDPVAYAPNGWAVLAALLVAYGLLWLLARR